MFIESAGWLKMVDIVNSCTIFRSSFHADGGMGELEIAADSYYELYCNGVLLPGTSLADLPGEKSVTHYDISLRQGCNVLAVRVLYLGEGSSTYSRGTAGLAVAVRQNGSVIERSGAHWRSSADPAWHHGLKDKVTGQLGFCFEYDARAAIAWESVDFDDSAWPHAQADTKIRLQYFARTVPVLQEKPQKSVQLVQQGIFRESSCEGTFADCFAADFRRVVSNKKMFVGGDKLFCRELPTITEDVPLLVFSRLPDEQYDGVYCVFDLGCESVGLLDMTIDVPEGTIIDIAHGEHLVDGGVRAKIGARNFADRYIAKEGAQRFVHRLRRMGGRYIELHIRSQVAAVGMVRLIETKLPLPEEGAFICDDRLFNRQRETGVKTMELCMHEHYEDCPWREQALYAYDSRNQALFGYYTWGNYAFAANAFGLLGRHESKEPGQLHLTAPSGGELVIPCFSLVWITALAELALFSGNKELMMQNSRSVDRILEAALARRDPASSLYLTPEGKNIWNFHEWICGLDRMDAPVNALYNLYLYEALRSASGKYDAAADELGSAIERHFYDGKSNLYRTTRENEALHAHTQALMLYLKLVPKEKLEAFSQAYFAGSLIPLTFSALPYLFRGAFDVSAEWRAYLSTLLNEVYDPMILAGATSLWETPAGAADFSDAGSLCHAWSSLGVYHAGAHVLGVRPLEAGFRKFEVKPYAGNLHTASGTVPTPDGAIRVTWQKSTDGTLELEVDLPETLQCTVEQYPECPVSKKTIRKVPLKK